MPTLTTRRNTAKCWTVSLKSSNEALATHATRPSGRSISTVHTENGKDADWSTTTASMNGSLAAPTRDPQHAGWCVAAAISATEPTSRTTTPNVQNATATAVREGERQYSLRRSPAYARQSPLTRSPHAATPVGGAAGGGGTPALAASCNALTRASAAGAGQHPVT